jgi:hypothetical protein
MRRIRSHLTYANVMATLAVFIALGGGTAVALNGSNTVQSDDLGPGAQVKAPDVADNAVNSADVTTESLTGADIKNRSGVETCSPGLKKLGRICGESDSVSRNWFDALDHCSSSGLRLPTPGEAVTMAQNFDVPGVPPGGVFWTDNEFFVDGGFNAVVVSEDGGIDNAPESQSNKTVCVAIPSA